MKPAIVAQPTSKANNLANLLQKLANLAPFAALAFALGDFLYRSHTFYILQTFYLVVKALMPYDSPFDPPHNCETTLSAGLSQD